MPASASAQNKISGTGEMADLNRSNDWTQTDLGPIESWSEAIVISVNMMLASPLSTNMYLGEQYSTVYNDAYSPNLAGKHPDVLGKPGPEVWPEAWTELAPIIQGAYQGQVTEASESYIPLLQHGKLENRWWSFACYPIYDRGQIIGACAPAWNETEKRSMRLALEDSNRRLAQVLAATKDSIVSIDRNWQLTYLNENAIRNYSNGRNIVGNQLWDEFSGRLP